MNEERTRVSLHRWSDLSSVDAVLAQCLADLGGIEAFVRPGQTVVIKPNITANAPSDSGGTTHMELVEAIVRQVQRCSPGRVVVAEGTGAFGITHESAFPTGGWREMAARTGVELWNLDAGPFVELELENPRYEGTIPFSQLIYEADVFITVPCIKTHITADYTVVLKNAYGQTPQWKRSEIHRQYLLEQSLVDLNRIRKPDLCVVDGYDGAEGIAGGTDFERPAGARLMLVGTDPVAVDVISRDLMEFSARTRYLTWAIEDGLGIANREQIEVLGESVEDLRRHFMTSGEELCLFLPDLTLHDCDACSGCRIAAQSAMNRFRYQKLLKPVDVIYGGLGDRPQPKGETFVIGNCAERFADLGTHIGGCPAPVGEIIDALEAAGVICHICRDRAADALPALPAEFKAHLRVVAAGAEVFAGDSVERDKWHLQLLVGDCMKRYAFAVEERASQFGIDPDRDIVWLRGCPVEADAITQALDRLHQVFLEHGTTADAQA